MRKSVVIATASAAAAIMALTGGAASSVNSSSPRDRATYTADLSALNAGVHTVDSKTVTIPTARGSARITQRGDEIEVRIRARGLTAMTLHPQHIHAGTTCPDISDDVNGDSYVDVIEGIPKYGAILVPLDSDLNDAAPSLDFPVSDRHGRYQYREDASRAHVEAELKEALNFGDRHVVIHGISPDDAANLPASVQSLPGLPAWATLPVACGELTAR